MAALRAVTDDGDPAAESAAGLSSSVKTAADSGSRRDLLVALRDRIAADIDEGVPARDLASLSLRLLAISAEIAEIDAAEEGDDVADAASTPDETWPAT